MHSVKRESTRDPLHKSSFPRMRQSRLTQVPEELDSRIRGNDDFRLTQRNCSPTGCLSAAIAEGECEDAGGHLALDRVQTCLDTAGLCREKRPDKSGPTRAGAPASGQVRTCRIPSTSSGFAAPMPRRNPGATAAIRPLPALLFFAPFAPFADSCFWLGENRESPRTRPNRPDPTPVSLKRGWPECCGAGRA